MLSEFHRADVGIDRLQLTHLFAVILVGVFGERLHLAEHRADLRFDFLRLLVDVVDDILIGGTCVCAEDQVEHGADRHIGELIAGGVEQGLADVSEDGLGDADRDAGGYRRVCGDGRRSGGHGYRADGANGDCRKNACYDFCFDVVLFHGDFSFMVFSVSLS